MITVEEADQIILSQVKDFGTESVQFENALNYVLAENLLADRDMPPFNRSSLDGIAINYKAFENGIRSFQIISTQAAGDVPVDINNLSECVEIMTGAALPPATDTVIGYEDISIENGIAILQTHNVHKEQGVHAKGKDKLKNEIVAFANQLITPVVINMAASIGKITMLVKKLPRVIIISTGNELVEPNETPSPFEIRRSNSYMIKAALTKYNVPADIIHIPDDVEITKEKLRTCLENFDVIILSGGVSMGRFDYVPKALEELCVTKLFHKVKQRPGKPFWFGAHTNGVLVFALPGNPVSAFMCLQRYFIPWLKASIGLPYSENKYAILNENVLFTPALKYFLQVKLSVCETANVIATPVAGNSSGDFANLLHSNAFMELPSEQNNFTKGAIFKVWPFKEIFFLMYCGKKKIN